MSKNNISGGQRAIDNPEVEPSHSGNSKKKWIWGGVGGVVVVGVILAIVLPLTLKDDDSAPWNDPILPEALAGLFNSMNNDQKMGQLNQFTTADITGPATTVNWQQTIGEGQCGSLFNINNGTWANQLQAQAMESMGIPLLIGYDTIHGYRTIFPINLALASSWDTDLVYQAYAIAANESLSEGVQQAFTPMVDVSRDSRWGRMSESHGEDPYLSSRMAEAIVKGLQDHGVLACVKHFAAYGGAESGRDYNLVDMSYGRLFNEYLVPYKAAVDAGVRSVMTSFNTINFMPSAASDFLMQKLLKKDWNFTGLVVTDYGAVMELTHHEIAEDWPAAGVAAINAGTDMEMAAGVWYLTLNESFAKGLVSQERLDDATKRVLRAKWDAGLFNLDGSPRREGGYEINLDYEKYMTTQASLNTALKVAESSIVLLKNKNNVLPYTGSGKVLIVGTLAQSEEDTLGNWWGQGRVVEGKGVIKTVYTGMTEVYGTDKVSYRPGTQGLDQAYAMEDHQKLIDELVNDVKNGGYDMVVTVFGESWNMSGEATSRADLDPCCGQREMIEQLNGNVTEMATPPRLVGVLFAGRGMTIEAELNRTDAMLHSFFPGTMGGRAVANILHGDANPSAKMSITIPRTLGQLPIWYSRPPTGRAANKHHDTAYLDNPLFRYASRYIDSRTWPLFPFGFGRSYTTFDYSNIRVSPTSTSDTNGTVSITVTIKNTGSYAGSEVAQLYVHDIVGSESRAVRTLIGFNKTHYEAGETKDVTFTVPVHSLGFYKQIYHTALNYSIEWVIEPGVFEFFVGPNSEPDWDPNGDLYDGISMGVLMNFTLNIQAPELPVTPPGDDILPPQLQSLFDSLSLDVKMGQMNQFMVGMGVTTPDGIKVDWKTPLDEGKCGSLFNFHDVEELNTLQQEAVDNMGIPLIIGYDVIHGYETIFPINLGLAATFDVDLAYDAFGIAATEARADGIQMAFSPMVDISRDSRWGRMSESHGEDPYLSARMAEAVVKGFQDNGMVACVKHLAAYGGAESGRDYNEVDMSMERLFMEYLEPYKAAVDAGVHTLMTSYNILNGLPASANQFLMGKVLKELWGFKGMAVSDNVAVMELTTHKVAEDWPTAATMAALAGQDMEMGAGVMYMYLNQSVADGKVPVERIDDAAKRILRAKWYAGLFDENGQPKYYVDPAARDSVMLQPASLDKAEVAASKAAVLLKNKDNALPISKDSLGDNRVLVLGTLADNHQDILGAWHAQGLQGLKEIVTVKAGFESVYGADHVDYFNGTNGMDQAIPMELHQEKIDEAIAQLTSGTYSMVVTVFGESQNMSGEATSRADLYPCCGQRELIEQVAAAIKDNSLSTKHVGILMAGRGMAIENEINNTDALFHAWFPGTRGGNAIAKLVAGEYIPGGRLPITMPRTVGQCPIYYGRPPTGRPADKTKDMPYVNDDIKYTSRYIDTRFQPLYPFGFGLTYTDFEYSDISVSPSSLSKSADLNSIITVSATVKNVGSVDAEEIPQLYIHDWVGVYSRPVRQLKGFKRVPIKAGESQSVEFSISLSDLGYYGSTFHDSPYDVTLDFRVEPGTVEMFVGPCSDPEWDPVSKLGGSISMGVATNFTITG